MFQNNKNCLQEWAAQGKVHFKGGGSTTTVKDIDYEYNARMADIAERQQAMAEEYFDFWQDEYKPLEQAQIEANMELLPQQTRLEAARMTAEEQLLPLNTEYQTGLLNSRIQETRNAQPVLSEYYKQALQGVNPDQKVTQARTDVAAAFKDQEQTLRRNAARMGLNPNSNRYAESMGAGGLSQARAAAGAMTQARNTAEDTNFSRLQSATNTFKAGLPA